MLEPMPGWARVFNITKGTAICQRCLIARTRLQRLIGLMGRKELRRDEGLLLTGARGGIHTCFVRFEIDVAYLDGEGRVVAIKRRMKPWRIWVVWNAKAAMALELPAGRLEETGTEIGDLLEFRQLQFGSPK